MLLTCRIYLNHDSDFVCQFLVRSFFRGGVVLLCYIALGGELEKCYIVLHKVDGWSKNTMFALYNNYVNGLKRRSSQSVLSVSAQLTVMTNTDRQTDRHTNTLTDHATTSWQVIFTVLLLKLQNVMEEMNASRQCQLITTAVIKRKTWFIQTDRQKDGRTSDRCYEIFVKAANSVTKISDSITVADMQKSKQDIRIQRRMLIMTQHSGVSLTPTWLSEQANGACQCQSTIFLTAELLRSPPRRSRVAELGLCQEKIDEKEMF